MLLWQVILQKLFVIEIKISKMMKIAFVTQTYKADYDECLLLCESIDRFVPAEIKHYLFVNDEDYDLFSHLKNERRKVMKKSAIIPKWLKKFPIKLFGHTVWVSPFTIPVRGWIIQQICKLGVFEVIKDADEIGRAHV